MKFHTIDMWVQLSIIIDGTIAVLLGSLIG